MFIFRMEHDRSVCCHPEYRADGSSLTGHGPLSHCMRGALPNYGAAGNPPSILMMTHERCAVTARQFDMWISKTYNYSCRMTTVFCKKAGDWCADCVTVTPNPLTIPIDWNIVAYWVEDKSQDVDWRYDNDQVVFNPEFAICMGTVTYKEVIAIRKELLGV